MAQRVKTREKARTPGRVARQGARLAVFLLLLGGACSSALYGDAAQAAPVPCGDGTILRTDDGGTTWQRSRPVTHADLLAVGFVSAAVGWTDGADGTVLKTVNGGRSWVVQTTPVGRDDDCMGVKLVSSETGWITLASGRVLKTTNGGRTWRMLQAGVYRLGGLVAVDALDARRVWVAGAFGAILYSDSGGD